MAIAKESKELPGALWMERAKTHPILIVAGLAVLLFSLLGAAAITGVVPTATSSSAATQSARS
jgi:hypothetical protein